MPLDVGTYSTPAWGVFGSWRVHGRHQGIDQYAPAGQPSRLRKAARITAVSYTALAGFLVYYRHLDDDHQVFECHFQSRPPVTPGREYPARTIVGLTGRTGNAQNIGDQVHLEVRRPSGTLVDPVNYFAAPSWAGGDTTPIEEEEDDMSKTTKELIQTPDGTVWYVVDRIQRYAIPSPRQLETYKAHLRDLGMSDAIVRKSAEDVKAYGAPTFADGFMVRG